MTRYIAALFATFLFLVASCNDIDKEDQNVPYLRIEGPTELIVGEGGTTQDYLVKSNGKWEVIRKSVETWAEAKPVHGQNDGSFRITVGENRSGANRSISFSFILDGNELQEKISVVQEGKANDDDDDDDDGLPLYTVSKIWNLGNHNAFTDLIEYEGKYFCVFREAGAHVPQKSDEDGKIRILVSTDGVAWKSAALIAKDGYDFRDPKLSITPDGRLMVLYGGAVYQNGQKLNHIDHVSFSENTEVKSFTEPQPILLGPGIPSKCWLWRVTWDRYNGYGVAYHSSNIYLLSTTNGISYTLVTKLDVAGQPNEATVEILGNNKMRIIVRREASQANGYVGYNGRDYTEWNWTDMGARLGGPDLITLPDGKTIIGSRSFRDNKSYTSLFKLDNSNKMVHLLELPSGGDTSYPGLIVVNNELWVSYYSSHEGKTSIYLAKVRYKKLFT